MPSETLSQRAYHLLQMIAGEIGPRPAGSEGEARFLDFAEGFFHEYGLTTRRQPVPNVPSGLTMLPMLAVGVAGLLWVVWVLPDGPWWTWIYIVLFSLFPRLLGQLRRQVGRKGKTGHNLAATIPSAAETTRTLVLCAHHDTARASRIPSPKLGELARNMLRLWPAMVLGLAALGVIRAVDMAAPFVPYGWWVALRDVLLVVLGLWGAFLLAYQIIARSEKYSPGANDNGSGVAVLMAAAEMLAREPLLHTSVDVVFFSAEENGLLGSEQYVKEFGDSLENAVALNLDMVGSGERIAYVKGAGMFPPRRTTAWANQLLKQARPDIRGRWYLLGNSDFYSFLRKKIPATSLEASGGRRDAVYHTDRDTLDCIEPERLGEAAEVVLEFARALDGTAAGVDS